MQTLLCADGVNVQKPWCASMRQIIELCIQKNREKLEQMKGDDFVKGILA